MLPGEKLELDRIATRRRLDMGWWLMRAEIIGTGLTFSVSLLALSLHRVSLLWFAAVPAVLTIAFFCLIWFIFFLCPEKV